MRTAEDIRSHHPQNQTLHLFAYAGREMIQVRCCFVQLCGGWGTFAGQQVVEGGAKGVVVGPGTNVVLVKSLKLHRVMVRVGNDCRFIVHQLAVAIFQELHMPVVINDDV